MNYKYIITSSPHILSDNNVRKIMLSVIVALLPSLVMGTILFGLRALVIVSISILSSVFFEFIFNLLAKKTQTINDFSAFLTGMILGLTLPSSVPIWMPVAGAFFAIVIVKQLFGGLGNNFLNPALTARVFLDLAWPQFMTIWIKPFSNEGVNILANVDMTKIVTSATPLSQMSSSTYTYGNILDLLWGNTGGTIGETAAILLILGGIYLIVRKIVDPRIPIFYIGTVAVLCYLFPQNGTSFTYMIAQILSGGLIFGAFFMATDCVTSPVTKKGKIIYGIICGIVTFIFRRFSGYPEGVAYAILIANILTIGLDRITKPRRYGKGGAFYERKEK